MIRRSTWILLLVLAVLVAFTLYFQKYQGKKQENSATATPTVVKADLLSVDISTVSEITISDSAQSQISFYRNPATSQWVITDVPVEQADSFQIESVLAQLFSIQVLETLTQSPPLDSISLAIPAYSITIKKSDGTQSVVDVGSATAIGSGYYVRVDGNQIVIVDKTVMDTVLGMLATPPLVATSTPETTPSGNNEPTATPPQ